MLELILKTDLESLQPIEFNYEALYAALNAKMEKYRNLVIEEKDIPDAKKDRADLNKLADGINAERIRIKKQYLEPYAAFERKLNELVDMVKDPCGAIDGKIKEFEARRKKEKRDAIEAFYTANVKELNDFLTFDKIYNVKWDTAAAKVIDITQEMMRTFERVKADLDALKSMKLRQETPVISKYLERLNLGDALAENARLLSLDEKAASIKPSAAQSEEIRKPTPIQAEPANEPQTASETAQEAEPDDQAFVTDFRVYANKAQLQALAAFMKLNNIRYGRVPQEQKEAI